MGKNYENVVLLELKRRMMGQDICFWRNKIGEEVDFLLKQGSEVDQVCQVVYDLSSVETENRELLKPCSF